MFRLRHGRPKARAPADRTVTAIGILRQVEIRFEFNSATVATAAVGFHRRFNLVEIISIGNKILAQLSRVHLCTDEF